MTYSVTIECAKRNYSAFVPDLPGCVATGATVREVTDNIRQAIKIHLKGMAEDGQTIPRP